MSDKKTNMPSTGEFPGHVGEHGWAPSAPVVGPANAGTTPPFCGYDVFNIDEEDIPLAERRRLRLAHAIERATAGTPHARHGVGGARTMMLRAHCALSSAIRRSFLAHMEAVVEASGASELSEQNRAQVRFNARRIESLFFTLHRAHMVTRHWLQIPPRENMSIASGPSSERTFTRSRSLANPAHGSWRGYREARAEHAARPHVNAGHWGHLAGDLDRMIENSGPMPSDAGTEAGTGGAGGSGDQSA